MARPNRRKAKSKQKKKPTLPKLKKKLWRMFSEYIRIKDTDLRGMGACCTCGKAIPWKHEKGTSQASHCFPQKVYPNLIYEEINVGLACSYCNGAKLGAQYEFSVHIKEKYGEDAWNKLYKKAKDFEKWRAKHPSNVHKWTKDWVEGKTVEYSEKLKKEKLRRNIK